MKPKLFFFHLPKCGGTSLWVALRDIYGTENCFQIAYRPDLDRFTALSDAERKAFTVVGGHHGLRTYKRLLGELDEYHRITVFREPIERLVSNYNFVRKTPQHPDYERVRKESFEEFTRRMPANRITFLLCGEQDPDKALSLARDWFDDWCLLAEVPDMILRLYRRAGVSAPKDDFWRNRSEATVSADAIPPAFMAELRKQQAADIAFYEGLLKLRTAATPALSA